jgi:hypothetical protein
VSSESWIKVKNPRYSQLEGREELFEALGRIRWDEYDAHDSCKWTNRRYLSDFFPNLPQPFKGLLRLSVSSGAVSVVALRQRYNEGGDYLITTAPPSLETASPGTAVLSFPHIVNGGGYTTQFVLFSGTAGQATGGNIRFYRQNGTSMPLSLR